MVRTVISYSSMSKILKFEIFDFPAGGTEFDFAVRFILEKQGR